MFIRERYRFNKAFTLAEILITLVVIGIVAALTIPNLIQTTTNKDTVVKVKKYQSLLEQAIKNYARNNGCIDDLSQCNAFSGNSNHAQAWNAIKSHFSIVKDCGTAIGQGCWAKGVMYKLLNGENDDAFDNVATAKAILGDGVSISLYDRDGNCTSNQSRNGNTPLVKVCGVVRIDTNGHKRPNQGGRDSFLWWITTKGVYPMGNNDDLENTYANGTIACDPAGVVDELPNPGWGDGCTAKVIKEAAINY